MERVCFVGRVKTEWLAEYQERQRLAGYQERHERVWPEMLAALREAGWKSTWKWR